MVLLLSCQLTAHASTPAEMAPEQVTGTITINTETTKLLFDKGYLFVVVRKLENFNQGHIPAAQHLAVRSALFTASNWLCWLTKIRWECFIAMAFIALAVPKPVSGLQNRDGARFFITAKDSRNGKKRTMGLNNFNCDQLTASFPQ
ncbi:hypothetical protein SAMN05421882_102031 [Nitrosomonas communis]|uniref:Rhodanese-like domain-containing protein n=2 Tax=Nitrosomonas communis TaxID=44574 RepID=A0A1H2VAI4_9PROT|nr:hypothetical protein SAMN05421882_102031 [Nitrosomonas communis]